ncbi:hypothetical protein H6P81_012540 [Aristolochia fimbriata]|uniref:Uncharacterized protein n=1 Tax=Aristolochia fimbriata TaxID=158543 RepID=A0AAV7EFR4_ARIFI|nr:hypothetical protein H6P81_012540 [Aristolochia fimbriata]
MRKRYHQLQIFNVKLQKNRKKRNGKRRAEKDPEKTHRDNRIEEVGGEGETCGGEGERESMKETGVDCRGTP